MRLITNAMDVTTDTYTIQGWLKSSSGPSFEETLFYDNPSRTVTDALPGKAGLITEWTSWQKGTTADGAASQSDTYAYEYDGTRRLVGSSRYSGTSTSPLATLTEKDIAYDRNGSLLSLKRYGASSGTAAADSLSFTYTGTKRSGYSYDAHGNVTADPLSGTALAWNVIGLPMSVSDGTDTARRVYAADGTLLAVYSGSIGTEGRVRIGNFDILSSSSGALTLESAAWEGGRLLPGTGNDKILYHITDHLGSVRVVKDGTGAVRQRFDYYPFGSVSGSWSSSTNPSQPSLRYRFSGKEIAGQIVDASPVASALAGSPAAAAGTPYLDFGARLYDPRSAAWLSQDPLAEKYYGISPYAYCAGNPVSLVDPEGMEGVKTIDENGNVTITSNVVVLLEKQHAIPEDASDSRAKKINSNNERIAKRNQALLEMVEGFLSVEFSNATTSDGRKVSFDFNIIPVEVSDPTRTTFSEARVIALENGIKGVDTGRRPGEFGYDVALAAVIGQGSSGGHLGLTTGKVLITANDFSARTIAHEIGHTFKLEDNTTGFYGGLMDAPANPLSSYNVETIIKNAYVKK